MGRNTGTTRGRPLAGSSRLRQTWAMAESQSPDHGKFVRKIPPGDDRQLEAALGVLARMLAEGG